ncbi:MAG TPA: prepilin-type N-terminal cleavage/methylation domain-containing protein, partial [Rariglobus sp.]
PPSGRVSAFTLVELLTVIAIAGILAAILIPVVGSVRAGARAATCSSNLRQIGVAARLWSGENKGLIVPVFDPGDPSAANWLSLTTWAGMLAPYTGWQKPDGATAFRTGSDVPALHCPDLDNVFGYGYNYTYLSWMGSGSRRWARYSEVPRPSRTLMIVDSVYTGNAGQWRAFVRPAYTPANDAIVDYRHPGDRANVLWVDGHVSAEKKDGEILMDQNYWGVDVPRSITPM